MDEQKTKPNRASVKVFLDRIADDRQKRDALRPMSLMRRMTGKRQRLWGDSIIGFGRYLTFMPAVARGTGS